MSLDLEILGILTECEFPPLSYRNFAGISRTELRRLTLDDLESRLLSYLPPSPARASLITRFIAALFDHHGQGHCQSHLSANGEPIIPITLKQEAIFKASINNENAQDQNSHVDLEGSDENGPSPRTASVSIIQVNDPDLEIVCVVDPETKAKERNERIVHVNLEEEDGDETQKEPPPLLHLPLGSGSGSTSSSEEQIVKQEEESSIPVLRRSARKRKAEMPPPTPVPLKRKKTPAQSRNTANITVIKQFDNSNVSTAPPPPTSVTNKRFFLGCSSPYEPYESQEKSTDKDEWERLTSQASSVKELIINSDWNCILDPKKPFDARALFLPNLTKLEIQIEENDGSSSTINYSMQLVDIINGSPSLSQIKIFYEDEVKFKSVLRALGSVPAIRSLSCITIRHYRENCLVTIRPSELLALGQIKAPNLKYLLLDACIWADEHGTETKVAFQEMLSSFPNLTYLAINGVFLTSAIPWPKIILDFSMLSHLQELYLGESCAYSLTFETVKERPKKAKRKKLIINSNLEVVDPEKTLAIVLSEDQSEEQSEEHFPVSVNIQGLKPLLELKLGVLYELKSHDFSELPALKTFKVASQWAESYNFPMNAKRKGKRANLQTSKVEELQFPDSFQNYFLMTKILQHFSNLTHVYLILPTVKFLRGFAKAMHTTGPKSFKHLIMNIRFDFESSLDSCILDRVQSPSPIEREQLKSLKAYPHWEDYVLENQIELPQEEDIEGEDGNKFCGLSVLFKKLKTLTIRHIPRTLRIPKGPRHWIDDPNPEFSDTIIGFKEYPFHDAVNNTFPSSLEIMFQDFDMSGIAGDFRVKPYVDYGKVELNLKTSSIKKEVKLE